MYIFWCANDPIKGPHLSGLFGLYSSSLSSVYLASFFNLIRPAMSSTNEVHTSVFEDAVLQLFLGAGPNGLGQSPEPSAVLSQAEQSSHFLTPPRSRAPTKPKTRCPAKVRDASNDGTPPSPFSTVMEMMERMSWRLIDFWTRVYQLSGDSTPDHVSEQTMAEATAAPPTSTTAQVSRPTGRRSWADIPPEERLSASDYNATLNWDKD